jgi:hypothetical protein
MNMGDGKQPIGGEGGYEHQADERMRDEGIMDDEAVENGDVITDMQVRILDLIV